MFFVFELCIVSLQSSFGRNKLVTRQIDVLTEMHEMGCHDVFMITNTYV